MPPKGSTTEISSAPLVSLKSLVPDYLHNGLAGATSGALSRMVTAPFDVAKIRYQLDHRTTGRYNKSLLEAMRSIYSEEGVVSLWRGNMPAMLLWAAFSGVQFGTYEQLLTVDPLGSAADILGGERGEKDRCRGASVTENQGNTTGDGGGRSWSIPRSARHFIYGATSGAIATVATYPLDIARTALAYQGVPKRYEHLMAFVSHTLRESGSAAFFRGSLPALVMIAPQMGVSFAVYDRLKRSIPVGSLGRPPQCIASTRDAELDTISACGDAERGSAAEHLENRANRGRKPTSYVSGAMSSTSRQKSMGEGAAMPIGLHVLSEPESNGQVQRRVSLTAMTTEDGTREKTALILVRQDGGPGWDATEHGRGWSKPEVDRLVRAAWPMVSGGVAGMASKLAVLPLDTMKKRLQKEVMLQRDVSYGVLPRYYGPIHAVRTIVEEEGVRALFRGSVPALWKSGISTAVTFAVYEWVKTGLSS